MFTRVLPLKRTVNSIRNVTRARRCLSNPAAIAEEALEDSFGLYSVILPDEPFVFGVSHIKPRDVPSHIIRPPYALSDSSQERPDPEDADGRIPLGSEAERKLRNAASLARDVREYAGRLVKVCFPVLILAINLMC